MPIGCEIHIPLLFFAKLNKPQFFDAVKSFNGKRIGKYPVDGWHIANSLMIISFCSMPRFYQPVVHIIEHKPLLCYICDMTAYAIVFNGWFNLFYDKALVQKRYR